MRFCPLTDKDRKEMLREINASSPNELFADIPKKFLLKKSLALPPSLNELQLRKEVEAIAAKNKPAKQLSLFLGAGCYNHFIPAAVSAITGRSEFYTAYTPYQPEISQGLLQAIFEWQTFVCMLTGMDLANASMYDGASATAEAMLMAKSSTGRKKALVEEALNPEYKAVVRTYANANGLQVKEVEMENAAKELGPDTACLIVQQPDFFGRIIELEKAAKAAKEKGAVFIVAVAEALAMPFLSPDTFSKADIVTADCQSLGNSMSFGGPAAGVIACRQRLLRQIPGRLVGRTLDKEGKPGFALTLQTREQHIRRERAGSNICSNQALCALASTVYLAAMGEKGLRELANENHRNAEYLAEKLEKLGFKFPLGKGFFNEFVVKHSKAKELQEKLLAKGIVFGMLLEEKFPEMKDCILLCATEMNSKQEMDALAKELEGEL